jgi:hypothetical protein
VIRINLALKRKIDIGGEPKAKGLFGIRLGEMKASELRQLPIAKLAAPIVIGLLCNSYLEKYEEDEIQRLKVMSVKYSDEGVKLQKGIEKFKKYESLKKDLDADEEAIRNKLETIQKLISNRKLTEEMVIFIAKSIPNGVWVKELNYSESVLDIKGGASEYNQISDFMKALSESALFSNVELKNSERTKDKNDSGHYQLFELRAQRR